MHQEFLLGYRGFREWIDRLFRQPVFIFVTLWGHLAIALGALAFLYFEREVNPAPHGYFSAYYWAISTATTVGSADMTPMTMGGKCVAVVMMVVGSLFLWSHTALFAAALVAPAVRRVSKEVAEVEGGVEQLEREVKLDQAQLERLVAEIERLNRQLNQLKKRG